MAKLELVLNRDIDELRNTIIDGIVEGSMSATLEDTASFRQGETRCEILVFERYSYTGSNRVSMNVTMLTNGDGSVHLFAITSGGSSAVFFKFNTWGEEAFLEKLREIL